MAEYIGFIAAFLTTTAFLPQVIQVIKTRSTKDLSLTTYCFFWLGVVLWLIYGIIQGDLALIVANGITAVLAGIVLFHVVVNSINPDTNSIE